MSVTIKVLLPLWGDYKQLNNEDATSKLIKLCGVMVKLMVLGLGGQGSILYHIDIFLFLNLLIFVMQLNVKTSLLVP